MTIEKIWIAGTWRDAFSTMSFQATNPATGAPLQTEYPVSAWPDCEDRLPAALHNQTGSTTIGRTIDGH